MDTDGHGFLRSEPKVGRVCPSAPVGCADGLAAAEDRRALVAALRGRFHVTVEDIEALAYPVLRHRLVPTFNAEAEGITVDDIVRRVLKEPPRHEPKKVM